MRTVPATVQRADGTVEETLAVEHEEVARHPLTGYPTQVVVTEFVEPVVLRSGDSVTFTVEETW